MTASSGPNNTTAPAESWSPTSGRRDLGEGRWGRSGRRGTELAHTSMASFVRGVNVARAIRFFIVLAGVLLPCDCVGGGTVSLAEIDPLLRQKPEVRTFLMSALDMDSTVMAAVRFGSHVQHLGGAHMGPYMIQARPRTPKDALRIEVVLCTDARFFDASGKLVQDEMDAVRLEEKLTVVMLREVNSAPAIANCP